MSCDDFSEAIGELVDDTLDAHRARALDGHLATCPSCRALVADLRRIRQTAGTLDRLTPPPAVWTDLSARLRAEHALRQRSTRGWRLVLAAAAAVLLLFGGALAWRSMSMRNASQTVASQATAAGEMARSGGAAKDVQSVETELRLAAEHYENAIAGLEVIAKSQQKTLDPQLSATLQKNLAVIDQAIGESQAALREQPASRPAQESLFEAFRNKVALLQDTVALVNEMRKGNQAEAARIVGGLSR